MKSLFWIVLTTMSLNVATLAQEQMIRPAVSSTISSAARYEVVEANFGTSPQLTFRLDKQTGRVFQLSACPQRSFIGNGSCWKEMTVLELPKPSNDSVNRFQIFIQGGNHTRVLLINSFTGFTWQHGVDGADKWTPFIETIALPQSFELVK